MEGGPGKSLSGNVFSLRFYGRNGSQKEVKLKHANIISAVTGASVQVEIFAQGEIVPLDKIELVPPGAPIEMVAKFGPPDPSAPDKILGIDTKAFLETWKQFTLNVEDDGTTYRIPYNEGDTAPLFPGMAGPRISKKSAL
jgi:hypothetical protein